MTTLSHQDALDTILANECPRWIENENGEHDENGEIKVFQLEGHCQQVTIRARLASTYQAIRYEIVSVE